MSDVVATGHCSCGQVAYELRATPLFVHCCHCTWCQRETGAAFAINALIETDHVHVTKGQPETTRISSNSGNGQDMVRCGNCQGTLWSHYSARREKVAFIRVGTLDDPNAFPPDIHIFTSSKQDWVTLGDGKPVMAEYYRRSEHWPAASVERYNSIK